MTSELDFGDLMNTAVGTTLDSAETLSADIDADGSTYGSFLALFAVFLICLFGAVFIVGLIWLYAKNSLKRK